MEDIEETAIASTPIPPKIWKRYVDDSFCIIKKNAVTPFHNSLNSNHPHISFTIEHESNGQLPFLDTLISCNNETPHMGSYRRYSLGGMVCLSFITLALAMAND